MLFILTGDIQTGKTRWLEAVGQDLAAQGVAMQGVLAPGVWREGTDPAAMPERVDANGFEKLGIDNLLLPQGERIPFARRRDIAEAQGLIDASAQSEKANLGWHIDEQALDRINGHLASLPHPACQGPSLLVIDELGPLELVRGGGLVEAVRLLDAGPTDALPHALIVVRATLLDTATARFTSWGEPIHIRPGIEAACLVGSAFQD